MLAIGISVFANSAGAVVESAATEAINCSTMTGKDAIACGICVSGGGTEFTASEGAVKAKCKDGSGDSTTASSENAINSVINIMLFVVGVLSIVVIIYSGIRYVMSSGDSGKVKDAKNTLMYAVIGLIISIFAFVIVNWFFGNVAN